MTAYHCYIEYHEAVYASDIEAGSPERAAERAAEQHHISGIWTVISGQPVEVNVTEITSYEGQIAEQPLP